MRGKRISLLRRSAAAPKSFAFIISDPPERPRTRTLSAAIDTAIGARCTGGVEITHQRRSYEGRC